MTHTPRRTLAVAVLSLSAVAVAVTSASATAAVTSRRLSGADRHATAQDIAVKTFTGRPVTPILATSANFPDALVASYAAGGGRSPILLTPKDSLAPEALAALTALNAPGVILVGGPDAVSDAVQADLRNRGFIVDRLFGLNRYETARSIAQSIPFTAIGSFPGQGRTAIVARGDDFPDALAGGPLSYPDKTAFPLLLTDKNSLSNSTAAALDTMAIKHVLLLGGVDAVTDATKAQIEARGITVRRIGGINRSATAVAIADMAITELGFSRTHVNLARGDLFPDALSGSPHAGDDLSPILLTATPDSLDPATVGYLNRNAGTLLSIDVFGGTAAVSDATVTAARQAAGGT